QHDEPDPFVQIVAIREAVPGYQRETDQNRKSENGYVEPAQGRFDCKGSGIRLLHVSVRRLPELVWCCGPDGTILFARFYVSIDTVCRRDTSHSVRSGWALCRHVSIAASRQANA